MIYGMSSDLAAFKRLDFHEGLNILLAEKSSGATERQSRNGAGKTSVIELLHFLLGSRVGPKSIFRSREIRSATFSLEFDLGGERISVSRSGGEPNRVVVDGELPSSQSVDPQSVLFGPHILSNEEWKDHLGSTWFRLQVDELGEHSHPSFRSLMSMFVRRQESGGFQSPTKHTTMQSISDQQITISYLMGLDWMLVDRFNKLKSEQKAARDLRNAMKSGEFGRKFGSVAELRTRLTVAEARANRLRSQLDAFNVIPEYRELEREASEITTSISTLNTQNIGDHELLQELERTLDDEQVPASEDLSKLYEEAGIVLPDLARRRLEDVRIFHQRIVENRRSHLSSEIVATRDRLAQREDQKSSLNDRRVQIMSILNSGGALDHFTRLREELGRSEGECQDLRNRLATGEELERTQTRLDLERNGLVQDLRNDIYERRDFLDDAVLLFEEFSQLLYEEEGRLVVEATPTGPKFEVHIAGERSKGITNMQIFCFDFMLAELGMQRGLWPGFLIHDSHLFDGVDERQVARALQIGAERAAGSGFQYVVTMNSDAIPKDGFDKGFCVGDYMLDVRLSDETETGGLFGIRFD